MMVIMQDNGFAHTRPTDINVQRAKSESFAHTSVWQILGTLHTSFR